MLVVGPTQIGKIIFVKQLLRAQLLVMEGPKAQVMLYYGQWQKNYDDVKHEFSFVHGLPQ